MIILMNKCRLYSCVIVIGLVMALGVGMVTFAHAARSEKDSKLSATEIAAVERISAYFNQLHYLQGEFVQSGPGKYLATGKFYLNKPGRLRFEYTPPNPILVVADGVYVIVKDRKLETADHYPIGMTPLKFVLAEKIDIINETKIIHVYQDPETLSVTLEDRSILVPGRLTLEFDNKTMELRQWVIVDGSGTRTTIAMRNIVKGVKADPGLFKVTIPNRIESDEY
jgi:outer membrane lipoprotein-sorting protein